MREPLTTARVFGHAALRTRARKIAAAGCPLEDCGQPTKLVDWGIAVDTTPDGETLILADLTCTAGHQTYGYECV